MNGLIFLSIGLTALVGFLCTLVYSHSQQVLILMNEQRSSLLTIEDSLKKLEDKFGDTEHRLKNLASDVLKREVYRSAEGRQEEAVKDAMGGKCLEELMSKYGFSSDEAMLIIALHGKTPKPSSTAGSLPGGYRVAHSAEGKR